VNRDRSQGYVYFITPEAVYHRRDDDLQKVKIGYTRFHPGARLNDLQCGSPVTLELLAFVQGGVDLERAFHEAFAELRFQGEWFYLHGKLFDFLGYFEGLPPKDRYVDRERLLVALYDNVLSDCVPHPSVPEADWLASADVKPLLRFFPELLEA
jgi:hypothetical protein